MRRPRSVTIVGWGILLYSLAMLTLAALALGVFVGRVTQVLPLWMNDFVPQGRLELALRSGQLALGVFMLVSAIGVLQVRKWAWIAALIVQGINLAILQVEYWRGDPHYWEMLVGTMLVFMLNQREVQWAFNAAQHRADPVSIRTAEEDQAAREAQASLTRS